MDSPATADAPRLLIRQAPDDALLLELAGAWRVGTSMPEPGRIRREISARHARQIRFDAREISAWDSALVSFASRVLAIAASAHVPVDRSGLPDGVQRLLALVETTPTQRATPAKPPPGILARIGLHTIAIGSTARQIVTAIGNLTIALGRLLAGRAKLRRSDLLLQMQQTGSHALGIVTLVAGLVGIIIAFISAVELESLGAAMYVANLVGIAMVRELGAVMTAIVVAGRTGAAFAAELGTMRVTQEYDAYTTLGVPPIEFLALPRILAVTLMMPLLCIYADLVGVLGGAVVGIGLMHVAPRLYYNQTLDAVTLTHLFGGLFKAMVYGFLIGCAGCFIGARAGRSAADVGSAATSAVVTGIVLVIAACGAFAVLFYRLGL